MRKGLTRTASCLLCGLLLGAVGCGTEQQEQVISETLSTVNEVTTKLSDVKKAVREAITKNAEKKQPITEPDEALNRAYASAQELRKLGDRLQRLKEVSDRLKSKTSEDYSKELAGRYRTRLEDNITGMQNEESALDVTLAEANANADANGKKKLDTIREELKKGRESFEVLTKQR